MHCVDLGESFQTHIYLQISPSIQPRTSSVKFAASHPNYLGYAAPLPGELRRGVRDARSERGPRGRTGTIAGTPPNMGTVRVLVQA